MAASAADDIPAQLAALFGKDVFEIRKTDQTPPRASLIDVAVAITGHDSRYSADAVRNACEKYPEVFEKNQTLQIQRQGSA